MFRVRSLVFSKIMEVGSKLSLVCSIRKFNEEPGLKLKAGWETDHELVHTVKEENKSRDPVHH